jgi:hypothetical protein
MIKRNWKQILLLGVLGINLFACQGSTDASLCQAAVSPFPTPATRDPEDALAAYAPNVHIGRLCTFHGQVSRGELYRQELEDGLVFCLHPSSSWQENDGWQTVITDGTDVDCAEGFNGIVTPPFHGTNPILIAGWHFRNAQNTAENEGSVNAPQKVREFNFLLRREDIEKVLIAHSCIAWDDCPEGLAPEEGVSLIAATPKSQGILTITDLELGNLAADDKAWIEKMVFEVQIYLPPKE